MEFQLQTSFVAIIAAIVKVFVIIALGYYIKRRKFLSDRTVTELTRLLITVILPCFLFIKVYHQFSLESFKRTYQMAFYGAGIIIVGSLLALMASHIIKASPVRRRTIIALCAFNNSAYLPIPLVYALLDKTEADTAAFFIAIYVLVISPFLWSWGVWLLSSSDGDRKNILKLIFSPPAIGIVVGIICAVKPVSSIVEHLDFLVGAATIIGEATVPLAMIIVGALLASIPIGKSFEALNMGVVILIKLIIMPMLVLFVLKSCCFPMLMGLVMLIQAAVPPASNLAIIAKNYHGDFAFISTAQLITYVITPFTMPVFLYVYFL